MLQLIKLLKANHFEIHFATTSQKTDYSLDTDALGINDHHITLNSSNFDELLKILDPGIVVFDRYITEEQFGWKVDECCPKALKVLDTEDLHFLREERELALKTKDQPDRLLSDKAKRELAAMYRCDLNLIISNYEYSLLREKYAFPQLIMHYLPFLVESDSDELSKTFRERKHFVSIGNFKHKPNFDMVEYTNRYVWPLIRKKLPDAEWHIYGAYMPDAVKQLHAPKKGVVVKVRAQDAVATLRDYKIMLAYLRFGAGLKQKCIDAMLSGTPISTTGIGAEGLSGNQEFSGLIANDIDKFVQNSVELYTNPSLWKGKHAQGFSILESSFSPGLHSQGIIDKITFCLEHLEDIRSKNTVGQLLKFHALKSTKYMSLWIQEKNRKDRK